MMDYDDFPAKEQQQLAVCQRLISEKRYLSQEEIRRDLQGHGFENISQSSVSRLLRILGVIKIRNTKGQKNLFGESTAASGTGRRPFRRRNGGQRRAQSRIYPDPYRCRIWLRRCQYP